MSLPWWELVLRAMLVYGFLIVLLRLLGKRAIGEITPFDLLLVLLVAEAAREPLLGGERSAVGSVLVIITLVSANYAIGFVSARSPRFDRLVDGEPVVVACNGRLLERRLRRNNVPRSDFNESMREAQISSLDQVRLAVLEPNGRITFLRRDETGASKPEQP
jgi:uncharacterized membrane protein YcaP (DUF421 family)